MSVCCLMGPTGVGKTALALALAERLPIEIISVDSVMVYRGLDIGTAKPSLAERERVAHHLIDVCEPEQPYSAATFCSDVKRLIAVIRAKNKWPLLVGGTMLYFRALQQGLSPLPAASPDMRAQITREAEEKGWAVLHQELAHRDPASALRIHPNDPQRLQRALEICRLTGQPWSALCQRQQPVLDEPLVAIGIVPADRAQLRQRLQQRLQSMVTAGLLDEVRALQQRVIAAGGEPDWPALRAVGYRQALAYLAGDLDAALWQQKALHATSQLAKRQLTWMRSWPDLIRYTDEDSQRFENIQRLIVEQTQ